MRSDPDKTKVLFLIFDSARGGPGTRAARQDPQKLPIFRPSPGGIIVLTPAHSFARTHARTHAHTHCTATETEIDFPVGHTPPTAGGRPVGHTPQLPILETNWHHSRILAVCNAILSTGMGPIFKNVAPVREWCIFSKAPQPPARRTGPGGQGRQGAKKTRNFEDFWGRKPIGNTPLE